MYLNIHDRLSYVGARCHKCDCSIIESHVGEGGQQCASPLGPSRKRMQCLSCITRASISDISTSVFIHWSSCSAYSRGPTVSSTRGPHISIYTVAPYPDPGHTLPTKILDPIPITFINKQAIAPDPAAWIQEATWCIIAKSLRKA